MIPKRVSSLFVNLAQAMASQTSFWPQNWHNPHVVSQALAQRQTPVSWPTMLRMAFQIWKATTSGSVLIIVEHAEQVGSLSSIRNALLNPQTMPTDKAEYEQTAHNPAMEALLFTQGPEHVDICILQ
jgi:hypothetical protein